MSKKINTLVIKIRNTVYAFLRWTEIWTKTDMIYLAMGGFWLASGQIIASISSFLTVMVFANLLPPETYGTYKYILSIAGILSISTLSGMGTSIMQSVSRGFDGSINKVIKTQIKYGLIGSLAGITISIYYLLNNNIILASCFLIVSIFFPIMEACDIYLPYLLGKKQFKLSTKYINISRILILMSMTIIIIVTKNLFYIILTYYFLWSLLRYLFLKISLKKFKPNNNVDNSTITYGKHLSLINIIPLLSSTIDKIMVFNGLGGFELAIYSIVIAPPEQIRGFLKVFNVLAAPKMSIGEEENIKRAVFHKIKIMVLFLTFIILIYILFCPIFFRLIFNKYQEFFYYSSIYSISLLTSGPLMLLNSFLQSRKKTKEILKNNILTSSIQLMLIIPSFYFWGILGIIISKIISGVFNLIFIYNLVKKTKYD